MFRFTIRDVLWLTVVVALGIALMLSEQRQAFQLSESQAFQLRELQLRELEKVRAELESANQMIEAGRRKYRNSINALIRELEKDRGRIGRHSFRSDDLKNPDEWSVKLELLDVRSP